MIDPRIFAITERLLDTELRLRDQSLARETLRVKEQATLAGALRSSGVATSIKQLALRELRSRTLLAWELLQRSLSDMGVAVTSGLSNEMIGWVDSVMEKQFQAMVRYQMNTLGPLNLDASASPLQDEAAALKQEVKTRIDYLVLTLERRASREGTPTNGNVFQFYGTVGAVQTGALSSAEVSQQFTQADVESLVTAIERVATEIRVAGDFAADDRASLLELTAEVRDELRKAKPNSLRVRQLAMGVATSIQTAGSLRATYELLKAALLPLGVILP